MSRIRTRDFSDDVYALGRSYLSMDEWDDHTRRGDFWSRHGFVRVFMADHPRWTVTSLTMIHAGCSYSRRWKALFGDRTVAKLAREFAEEVVAR